MRRSSLGWALVALLLLRTACSARNTHQFPSGGDEMRAILGEAFSPYVVEGCNHGTSGTTTTTVPLCRAYANDPGPPRQWQYFDEGQERTITYNTGNGTYWLLGHPTLTEGVAGWTRVAGTHYLWQMNATRPTIPADAILLQQSTVAGGAITAVVSEAPRWLVAQTLAENMTTGADAPWKWVGRGAVVTVAATKTLTLGTCPDAGRYQIFNANGVSTGLVRFRAGACAQVFPEWWGTSATTFQEAADALTTHGGLIDLGPGVYTQNTHTAKSNVVISGKGMGATTWRLADGQLNWQYGQQDNSNDVANNQVVNCGINNLTMDGNWTQNQRVQDSRGAIAARGFSRCHFHHLRIIEQRGDGVGSMLRTQDSIFEDLIIDFSSIPTLNPSMGRSCVGVTGGSQRNVFQNIVCINPINTCFDFEPADGVPAHYSQHFSYNKIHNWTCIEPRKNGFTASFGTTIALPGNFTGTRTGNSWSNLSVYRAGKHGFLLADLNDNHMSNLTAIESSHLEDSGRGIWIGGYSVIGASHITLTGCVVRDTSSSAFAGTTAGLYIANGDTPAVVANIAVSGCVITETSDGADLLIENMPNVAVSGTVVRKLSIAAGVNPVSIATEGQGPALASAAELTPLGLYDTYLVTGSTQVNEITAINGWLGRKIQLTFDSQIVLAHNNDSTQTPIYLKNAANVTFCAGDTISLRKTDVVSGETRWQEISRSRMAREVTLTTGGTPNMACATTGKLDYAAAGNITTFDNTEAGEVYTFWCNNANATLLDVSNAGNFQLAGNVNFVCTGDDSIQLVRYAGQTVFREVGRSVN